MLEPVTTDDRSSDAMTEGPDMQRRPGTPISGHGHSLPIGRIAGIPIRLHWTFVLLIGFVVLADWSAGGAVVMAGLVWIGALFSFVVAHEISHCLVARRRGATVEGILLLPIGGLSQLTRMPEAPDDELAVAIVGPLTSLGIGVTVMAAGFMAGSRLWPPTLFAGDWWARLAWLNLLLGAFNLLPALPMDGGRVLRAALARRRSKLEATLLAGRVARYLAGAMVVVGLFYDVWLVLIGLFVLLGANAEEQAARHSPDDRAPPRGPRAERLP
jgi:Zn-dependent protease